MDKSRHASSFGHRRDLLAERQPFEGKPGGLGLAAVLGMYRLCAIPPQWRGRHVEIRKWTWAVDENNRFIALGRPTYTERLRELAPETPFFLIGPELPDISSSQVRDALYEEDFEALAKLLHPAVVAWCLHHSPYRRCKPAAQDCPGQAGSAEEKGACVELLPAILSPTLPTFVQNMAQHPRRTNMDLNHSR